MSQDSDDGKSAEERIMKVESIYVVSPKHQEILDEIKHTHQYSKISAQPEGMLVTGPQGAGKTKIFEYYARKFKRVWTPEEGSHIPVLLVQIEVPATPKNLVTVLLEGLGDPAADRGNSISQTLRARHLLKECGTELIILDDFQHFIDRDSLKVLKTVSDWLKVLMDKTKIPIVLGGMPYSHLILDAVGNEQLKRRFSVRKSLDRFGWGDTTEKKKGFRAFLRKVDEGLPFSARSHLGGEMMAFRFYCATNGLVYKTMRLVRRAAELAINTGAETVTLDLLAQAYDERLADEYPDRVNPFDSDSIGLEIKPFEDATPEFRILKDLKGKEDSTSDIFNRK